MLLRQRLFSEIGSSNLQSHWYKKKIVQILLGLEQILVVLGRALDVVFVTNEEIRKVSLKSKRTSILTSHTGLTVSGLAVDSRNHHVYWSTGKLIVAIFKI